MSSSSSSRSIAFKNLFISSFSDSCSSSAPSSCYLLLFSPSITLSTLSCSFWCSGATIKLQHYSIMSFTSLCFKLRMFCIDWLADSWLFAEATSFTPKSVCRPESLARRSWSRLALLYALSSAPQPIFISELKILFSLLPLSAFLLSVKLCTSDASVAFTYSLHY